MSKNTNQNQKLSVLNGNGKQPEPWYKDGLKFKCTECGKCCTGKPGYVWVTEEEIEKIAQFLDIPLKKVMHTYIRQKNNRYALIEKPSQNHDCVFLKDRKCQIYGVRPGQCRTFPWWIQNLKSPESWAEAAKECEGINNDAPLIGYEEIRKNLIP
jgi:Fe-S-cluster containining protein